MSSLDEVQCLDHLPRRISSTRTPRTRIWGRHTPDGRTNNGGEVTPGQGTPLEGDRSVSEFSSGKGIGDGGVGSGPVGAGPRGGRTGFGWKPLPPSPTRHDCLLEVWKCQILFLHKNDPGLVSRGLRSTSHPPGLRHGYCPGRPRRVRNRRGPGTREPSSAFPFTRGNPK